MKKASFVALTSASFLFSIGCVENGLSACNDRLELGIISPAPNAQFPQGFPIGVRANVRSSCGHDLAESGMFALTSTEEGELGGSWEIIEGTIHFSMDAMLRLGEHTLTLRGVSTEGSSGEDTVPITVIENEPPTVDLTSPDDLGSDFSATEGARIQGVVHDNAEPLEGLELAWTLNGDFFDGPKHPSPDGTFDFVADVPGGCHSLQVTVIDAVGQSASDKGDFVLWEESSEMNAYLWWSDVDGDGWGVPEGEILACNAPAGTVAFTVDEDCNDKNANVHPGHADYCDDGIDSDCDPVTPTGCYPWGEVDASYARANLAGNTLKLSRTGDLNEDGYDDFAVAFADQMTHIVLGPVLGQMSPSLSLESLKTTAHDYLTGELGFGMAGGKDVDGDGTPDLLLGNPDWTYACSSKSNSHSGRSYLLKGGSSLQGGIAENLISDPTTWESGQILSLHSDYTSGCDSYFSQVGSSVEVLDDMDGDGLPDLAIAGTIAERSEAGGVWIVLSADLAGMQSGDTLEDVAHLYLTGTDPDSRLGTAMASGDLDGDGLSDLIVSSITVSYPDTGEVFVVFGSDLPINAAQMQIQSIAGLQFSGVNSGDSLGTDIVTVGDLDGDGDDEFMVTAPGLNSGQGAAYIVPGFYEVFGTYAIEDSFSTAVTPNATSAVRLLGGPQDAVRSVGGVGDLNNDGIVDLLVGAPGHKNGTVNKAGAAYVLYGGAAYWGDWWDNSTGAARSDVFMADAAAVGQHTAKISSTNPNEALGWDVDWVGDLNADGVDDIAIGSRSNTGQLRIFFGGGT